MKKPILLLLAVAPAALLPSSGFAQTSSVLQLSLPPGQSSSVGKAACQSGQVSVVYEFTSVPIVDTNLTLFLSESSTCPDEASKAENVILAPTQVSAAQLSGTVTFAASMLAEGCPDDVQKAWLICAVARQRDPYSTVGAEYVVAKAQVSISYDSKRPDAPSLTRAEGGDGAVYLEWSGSDAGSWYVYYRPVGDAPPDDADPCKPGALPPPDAGADAGSALDAGLDDAGEDGDTGTGEPTFDPSGWSEHRVSDGSVRATSVKNLRNNQEYQFVVVAQDSAGNRSAPSGALSATPRLVLDFYRRYRCAGGTEEGGFGCSAAGAAALVPAAAAAALALVLRRTRRRAP